MENQIQLGNKVKDIVTGLEGVACAKIEYLNGCIQFEIIPKVTAKATEYPKYSWIDIDRLAYVSRGICVEKNYKGGAVKPCIERSHPD